MKRVNDIFRLCINKQLEPHGVTYDDVVQDPNWLRKYHFASDADYRAWKAWCIELLIKRGGFTRRGAEREFGMFDLGYGLGVTR